MNAVEAKAIIGKSVKIIGDLSGSEDLTMDGELQGTIKLLGARLTIGPAARIRGDIAAKDIVIFGLLDGDIRATGRVELRSSAIVQGNIYATSMSIEENAAYRGQVDPSRAQEPIPERPVGAGMSNEGAQQGRTLPAALAAVAASLGGGEADHDEPAPLFAETKG